MMKIRHLIVLAMLLGACAKDKAAASEGKADASGRNAPIARTEATKGGEQDLVPPGLASKRAQDNRKIIRTGRVELVVATYDDARAKIDKLLEQVGGYVDATQVNRRQDSISEATIVVRIPSTAFGTMMPKLREIGEVVSESTNASDITDQYVDIAARLAGAQTLEKRLLELATDKKGNIEQILAVEKELTRVRTEIESYEGTMRQWNDQIAMSTLTLSLSTKRREIAVANPGLTTRIGHAFADSMSALRSFGGWLVVTLIALAPWLVLAIPGFLLGRRVARRYRKLPIAIARQPEAPAIGRQPEPPPAA